MPIYEALEAAEKRGYNDADYTTAPEDMMPAKRAFIAHEKTTVEQLPARDGFSGGVRIATFFRIGTFRHCLTFDYPYADWSVAYCGTVDIQREAGNPVPNPYAGPADGGIIAVCRSLRKQLEQDATELLCSIAKQEMDAYAADTCADDDGNCQCDAQRDRDADERTITDVFCHADKGGEFAVALCPECLRDFDKACDLVAELREQLSNDLTDDTDAVGSDADEIVDANGYTYNADRKITNPQYNDDNFECDDCAFNDSSSCGKILGYLDPCQPGHPDYRALVKRRA